jgi:hypothetical protein
MVVSVLEITQKKYLHPIYFNHNIPTAAMALAGISL